MSVPISAEKTLRPSELPKTNQEAKSQKLDCKPLISATIKYFLATKLSEKFGCFRGWEENSGKALFDNIKKVYGQKLVDTTVNSVTQIKPQLDDIQKSLNSKVTETIADFTGINQSVEVCREFLETVCSLLSEEEAGTTQTVDRLFTIAGVAYSENENIKSIVNKLLEFYSNKFFAEMLPKLIKDNCGIFAGPVEKLVTGLKAKDIVEEFLKERILNDYSSEKVLAEGDVYQKLILKGVKFIVTKKQDESQNEQTPNEQIPKLEVLLKDTSLSKRVNTQLQKLKTLYEGSNLTQSAMWMVPWLLERLAGVKNIANMSADELNNILGDLKQETINRVAGAGAAKVGGVAKTALDATAVGLGTVVGTGIRYGKDVLKKGGEILSEAGSKGADLAKKSLNATAVATGTVVGATYRYVKEGVCWLGSFIGLCSSESTPEADTAQKEPNPQDEVPAESKSTEAPAGVVPDVKVNAESATAMSTRKVSVRKTDAPKAKTAKSESKSAEVLDAEKKLEDDFGEYLQELFKEESPAQKSVEQKDEEGAGIVATIASATVKGAKKVGNGVGVVAPVVGKAALKTAEIGGKVAWEGTKLLSRGVLGAVKLAGRGVV
ncbi:MAG: hypothetical protein ACSW8C_01840, partial [bacterium]